MDEGAIEQRLTRIEEDIRANRNQHQEFFAAIEGVKKDSAIIQERYTNILSALNELKTDVSELKDKPAKRWDMVITQIIISIVTAGAGFVIGMIM